MVQGNQRKTMVFSHIGGDFLIGLPGEYHVGPSANDFNVSFMCAQDWSVTFLISSPDRDMSRTLQNLLNSVVVKVRNASIQAFVSAP